MLTSVTQKPSVLPANTLVVNERRVVTTLKLASLKEARSWPYAKTRSTRYIMKACAIALRMRSVGSLRAHVIFGAFSCMLNS